MEWRWDGNTKEEGWRRKIKIRRVRRARGRKCGEGREEIKRNAKNKAREIRYRGIKKERKENGRVA